jgi:hypothetical protein
LIALQTRQAVVNSDCIDGCHYWRCYLPVPDWSRLNDLSVADWNRLNDLSVSDRSRLNDLSVSDRSRLNDLSVADWNRLTDLSVADWSRLTYGQRLTDRRRLTDLGDLKLATDIPSDGLCLSVSLPRQSVVADNGKRIQSR